MDEAAKMMVTILGAGGGTTLIITFARGFMKWRSGEAHREQVRNSNAEVLRVKAIAEREDADDRRREAEEHVSILQRQLLLLGETPKERPIQK